MWPISKFNGALLEFQSENKRSRATPITSTGKISGDSRISRSASLPGTTKRVRAKAAGRPNRSAPAVAQAASSALKPSDARKSVSVSTLPYQARVKPRGGNAAKGFSEIDMATITTNGANTKIITQAVSG